MSNRMTLCAVLTVSLAAAGCGGGPLAPQEVPVDRVNCAHCGMLVSEVRHAAQLVAAGEDPRFYDDIGCMRADEALKRPGMRAYVRSGDAWIDAQQAWFARPEGIRTPMGSGIMAFRSEAEARRADRTGRASSWAQLEEPGE